MGQSSSTSSNHCFSSGFYSGASAGFSSALLITLAGTFMGFGALAQETGLSANWAGLTTVLIYSVPAQVILVNGIGQHLPPWEIGVAVAISGLRFAPMVAVLTALLRGPDIKPRHTIL